MLKAVSALPFNLPRSNRLTSKHDFQVVFAKPNKHVHRCWLALYQSNQRTYARLGIIVNKQRVPHAVDRNRLKRIVRESFRQHKELLKGLDLILLLRSTCDTLQDKPALRRDIDTIWHSLTISLPAR